MELVPLALVVVVEFWLLLGASCCKEEKALWAPAKLPDWSAWLRALKYCWLCEKVFCQSL